jgi:hypothetical protein
MLHYIPLKNEYPSSLRRYIQSYKDILYIFKIIIYGSKVDGQQAMPLNLSVYQIPTYEKLHP